MNNFLARIPSILKMLLATAVAVVFIILAFYFMAFIIAAIVIIAIAAFILRILRKKHVSQETGIIIEHEEDKPLLFQILDRKRRGEWP